METKILIHENQEPFKLIKSLGTGGFAQTWLAKLTDPILIKEWGIDEVAVKIPLSKEKERTLKKELELAGGLHMLLSKVESKNIVKYLGLEIFDNKPVMVMEYISGGDLRCMIGKIGHWKKLELKKILKIALGILNSISVIHRKHIIHRDIKPSNILMDGEIPKLTDLGISRMLKKDELASTQAGTLYYMSPEMLISGKASFNTDIWSFGIAFYEMLCCRFPFGIESNTPPGIIINLISDEDIKLVFPKEALVPKEIQEIISKALKKNQAERYKTADEIAKDIRNFMDKENEVLGKEIAIIRKMLRDSSKIPYIEAKFKELINKYPESPKPYLHLGEFYNKQGDYIKAINIFKKGIEKDSENSMFYWNQTISYQKSEDYSAAINSLEKALEMGLNKSLERYGKVLLKTLKKKQG